MDTVSCPDGVHINWVPLYKVYIVLARFAHLQINGIHTGCQQLMNTCMYCIQCIYCTLANKWDPYRLSTADEYLCVLYILHLYFKETRTNFEPSGESLWQEAAHRRYADKRGTENPQSKNLDKLEQQLVMSGFSYLLAPCNNLAKAGKDFTYESTTISSSYCSYKGNKGK